MTSLESGAVPLPDGITPRQDYKGIVLPSFYTARVALPAMPGAFPLGSSGEVILFGDRRSPFQRGTDVVMNLVKAHVW